MSVGRHPEEVLLLRYDISGGMGAALCGPLLGMQMEAVWHTSIVVFGQEYFFDGGCGIARMSPRSTPFGRPLREESLGTTSKTKTDFEEWNRRMIDCNKFGPRSYNLIENNCNHYTHEAAVFLTGTGVPDDVINMIPNMMASPMGTILTPIAKKVLESGTMPAGTGMSMGIPIPSKLPERDDRARPAPPPVYHPRKRNAENVAGDHDTKVEEVVDGKSIPTPSSSHTHGASKSKASDERFYHDDEEIEDVVLMSAATTTTTTTAKQPPQGESIHLPSIVPQLQKLLSACHRQYECELEVLLLALKDLHAIIVGMCEKLASLCGDQQVKMMVVDLQERDIGAVFGGYLWLNTLGFSSSTSSNGVWSISLQSSSTAETTEFVNTLGKALVCVADVIMEVETDMLVRMTASSPT